MVQPKATRYSARSKGYLHRASGCGSLLVYFLSMFGVHITKARRRVAVEGLSMAESGSIE